MVSTIPARRQAKVSVAKQRELTRKKFGKQKGSIRGENRPLDTAIVQIGQGKKGIVKRLPSFAVPRFGINKPSKRLTLG